MMTLGLFLIGAVLTAVVFVIGLLYLLKGWSNP